jgi:flagellar hook-associated protein 2
MSTFISGIGSISAAGIGSGLDVASIVTQLMAVEKRPLTQLQAQATALNGQVSTFGKLQSYFSALQDKSQALTNLALWRGTTATSGDAASVGVTTGANATAGSYAVSVQKLASVQTVTAAAQASSASTLNEGTLTIELGTWTGDAGNPFAAKAGATPVTVTIGAGETSLASIRDKINAADAGVTATIVTDASGARLSLRSAATGAENAFRIAAVETVDDGAPATGLSALAYDAAGTSAMTRTEIAANAQATLNGIDISSASNLLPDVVDGLTLNLLKTTTGSVTVSVAADTETVKTRITDLVSAFNELATFLRTQTAYDATTQSAGPLQGDQTVIALQQAMRNVLNQATTASTTFTRLSDVGITMNRDGTLAVDATKLDNALGNLPEMEKLLATRGADTASSGFAMRWKSLADAALATGGTFQTRTSSLSDRLSRNSESQEALQRRLDQTEARMRAQYTALDTKMSQLSNLSSYMTQQLAQFNNSYNHSN